MKQALLESIEKWDRVCFEDGNPMDDCALCSATGAYEMEGCDRCPIFMVTEQECCYGTVYYETLDGHRDMQIDMYLFLCMLYHEYYG
jgi:hypothetical protein